MNFKEGSNGGWGQAFISFSVVGGHTEAFQN